MNARKELLEEVKDANSTIKCAELENVCFFSDTKGKKFLLKEGYSDEDLRRFYEEIDFEYDAGYGSQELGGTVWFKDGTWLERGEYDGAEWWDHMKLPEIPTYLKK